MRVVLRNTVIIIGCIFLVACGTKPNKPTAPDLSHTDPEAVKALLEQEITGEITIYNYSRYDKYLRVAARDFMKEYPDVKIRIESFEPSAEIKIYDLGGGMADTQKTEPEETNVSRIKREYLLRVNTEMMGGGGPDIILADVIPFFRYADMGYFEDLRVYINNDPDFKREELRMNIIDAMEYRGGVYTMPVSFRFNYFTYDPDFYSEAEKEMLASKYGGTFSELIGFAEDAFERNGGADYMLGFTGGKYNDYNLFRYLLCENYSYFVDLANKRANFNDGAFEELLLSVTNYVENGYIQEESEVNDKYLNGEDTPEQIEYLCINPHQRFLLKFEKFSDLLWRIDEGRIRDRWSKENLSTSKPYEPYIGNDDNDEVVALAIDYRGGVPFETIYLYALCSNSRNKKTAWMFIKFLLSEETQKDPDAYLGGLPINRNSLEDARTLIDLRGYGYSKSQLNDENRPLWERYLTYLNELSEKINTYTFHDDSIDGWIEEEVTLYFDGGKSARDVARALQNKVNLYLNE